MDYYLVVNDKHQVADVTGNSRRAFEIRDELDLETGVRYQILKLSPGSTKLHVGGYRWIGPDRLIPLVDITGTHRTLEGMLNSGEA